MYIKFSIKCPFNSFSPNNISFISFIMKFHNEKKNSDKLILKVINMNLKT